MLTIFFSHRLISIFYTHTDRTDHTDLVRGEGAHGGLEHEIFLNTNNQNNTNVFWHTDLTDLLAYGLLLLWNL